MSRCLGCGAVLQTLNPDEAGYIPSSADLDGKIYCQRCFHIKHHNLDYSSDNLALFSDPAKIQKKQNEYYNLLQNIKNEKCLVLLLIDALDIYTGFIPNLKKIIGDNPVWILANKADLFPKDLKLQKIKGKIALQAQKEGLDTKNIFFISCLKAKNVDVIMERMFQTLNKKHNDYQNIYVIGATSVGKSTFINLVLQKYANTKDVITTSMEPNTTSNLIKVGIGKNRHHSDCYLIDTPGFLNLLSPLSCAPLETLKVLTPKNFIKVKTYQLKDSQTLYLGGMARLDFNCTDMVSVSCYVSDKLYIHRTKMENASKAYQSLKFKELVPPFSEAEASVYGMLQIDNYEAKEHLNLWIAGIGIIHIKGSAQVTTTHYQMVHITEDRDELS